MDWLIFTLATTLIGLLLVMARQNWRSDRDGRSILALSMAAFFLRYSLIFLGRALDTTLINWGTNQWAIVVTLSLLVVCAGIATHDRA